MSRHHPLCGTRILGGDVVTDFLSNHATEIWSFVAGLAGGGTAGSLLTMKFSRNNKASSQGVAVDQTNASARGDIVGRDKFTSTNG